MKHLLLALTLLATVAMAENPKSILDIPLKDIEGKTTSLKPFAGKVLLLVNVASECGNTPQYAGLQALYEQYKDKGLVVIGLPCNDYGGQEPGSNEEIKKFCTANYKVTFPMFDKLHAKGPEQHELYKALTGPGSSFPGDVTWNFGKFLISRDGMAAKRFEPEADPTSPEVVKAIEEALAAK
jgi:glutathione peroxidase